MAVPGAATPSRAAAGAVTGRLLLAQLILVVVVLMTSLWPPHAAAEPCTFQDGSDGFTEISELGVRKFVERAVKQHVIAHHLVPSQRTATGQITVLFDTPTKGVDSSLDVTAQTSGSTTVPVTEV